MDFGCFGRDGRSEFIPLGYWIVECHKESFGLRMCHTPPGGQTAVLFLQDPPPLREGSVSSPSQCVFFLNYQHVKQQEIFNPKPSKTNVFDISRDFFRDQSEIVTIRQNPHFHIGAKLQKKPFFPVGDLLGF